MQLRFGCGYGSDRTPIHPAPPQHRSCATCRSAGPVSAREGLLNLKPLTEDERTKAREKATAARSVRADIKAKIKTGEMSVEEVILSRSSEEAVGRLKVVDLLRALPGVGERRAAGIMNTVGIAPTRRVRGLGIHQRKALIELLASD